MAEFTSAFDWIYRTPWDQDHDAQAEHVAHGLALAREHGSAEDVASLAITLGHKLLLAERPEEALRAIEGVEIPQDLFREELPRYLANVYQHLGQIDRSLELIFVGFENVHDERLTPSEHEEYKMRRIGAVWTAALGGADRLRVQLKGMQEDAFRGYSYFPSEYPADEETILEASEGLETKDWLRHTVLPMRRDESDS